MDKHEIQNRLKDIEAKMAAPDFWGDKGQAQRTIQEYNDLKDEAAGLGKYDRSEAIVTIFAGAGGTDAEDFVAMLYEMYSKYSSDRGWQLFLIHSHPTEHGGYRNITFEVMSKGSYGRLKYEAGVHRLVRISPFNANQKRHTSFAMVEVVPKLPEVKDLELPEDELRVEFSKSGGPGGQNVNKRETAVRIVHEPTDIAVHVDSERTQEANRKRALEILRGKLYHRREEERKLLEKGLSVSKTTQNEWGSQIRSYVLHPYKLVKDHRTGTEVRDVESVLGGAIDEFIEAASSL